MAKARAAGRNALAFRVTAGGTSVHAAFLVGRELERGRRLLVAFRREGLRMRQAQGSATLCQGGNWQQRRNNDAQDKTHDVPPFSVATLTHKSPFGCNTQDVVKLLYVLYAGPGGTIV
jgi:hypothetical protein